MTETGKKCHAGRNVFLCFLAFFGTIALVDAAFVYTALRTNTGTVTDRAYEKGLAYNEVLQRAQSQPGLRENSAYQDGTFRWTLADESGAPLSEADVTVRFFRPVKEGHDFSLPLAENGAGIYEVKPELPLKGLWTAQLEAKWDNKQYRTTQDFIAQ